MVRATGKGERVLWQGRERRVGELVGLLHDLSPDELEALDVAARLVEQIGAPSIRSQRVCWRYRGKEVVRLE